MFHFKTLSLLKHAELSFLALPTEVHPPFTQRHTYPQVPSEVLTFKKGSKNFIWYQEDQYLKIKLGRQLGLEVIQGPDLGARYQLYEQQENAASAGCDELPQF